jgi:hypothetical protein
VLLQRKKVATLLAIDVNWLDKLLSSNRKRVDEILTFNVITKFIAAI